MAEAGVREGRQGFWGMALGRRVWGFMIVGFMIVGLVILGLFGQVAPAWGAIAQPDRVPLTVETLQQRLKTPLQLEGQAVLDLRRTRIDLRPDNAEFRTQFYALLRDRLTGSSTPLGIDLSYAQILGDFSMGELGGRSPLYADDPNLVYTENEQTQLKRDRRRIAQLSQLSQSLLLQAQPPNLQITVLRGILRLTQTRFEGNTSFANTFFLSGLEASGASFGQLSDWSEARFSQATSFAGALFRAKARFRNVIFFDRANFNQAQFQDDVTFQSGEFQATANFSKAQFLKAANLSRSQWDGNADFAQTEWQGLTEFDRSQFAKALFLAESTIAQPITFREVRFGQPVNLRGAALLSQVDFGDADFAPGAYLNVSALQFNPDEATILGNRGQIGTVISVPTLQGNETLLRNLVRNFRALEQIPDANHINYLTQKLHLRQLQRDLTGTNLNTATETALQRVGFSATQAGAIATARAQQRLRNTADVLRLDGIDLATYVKVRDRIVATDAQGGISWLSTASRWLLLSGLLLLTGFGTNGWLIFGVGLVAIALYALLFWVIDRVRRFHPQPILPPWDEALWIGIGNSVLALAGLSAIFRNAEYPWLTLLCLGMVTVPLPLLLTLRLYQKGRYHDQLTVSYFVEDGSLRQLRLLINRLPVIPKFPFFRDRYTPIPWDRRWNWLNYIDLSLNNLLRFGFNDIRLRDENLPGIISSLIWYQWSLGLLYIGLLLWTLSRTIPGVNLLIYFK